MPRTSTEPTSGRILDIAERLVQTRGFNGFSYADIAGELAITKASLHYHYPTKAALGRALIVRYHDVFVGALAAIDAASTSATDKLASYIALYASVLRDQRMCLCGMVAAEYATLPKPMQDELRKFFTANEVWLAKVVDEGVRDGVIRSRGSSTDTARLVLSALEGAMLVARSYRSPARFDETARRLVDSLLAEPETRPLASRRPSARATARTRSRRR